MNAVREDPRPPLIHDCRRLAEALFTESKIFSEHGKIRTLSAMGARLGGSSAGYYMRINFVCRRKRRRTVRNAASCTVFLRGRCKKVYKYLKITVAQNAN